MRFTYGVPLPEVKCAPLQLFSYESPYRDEVDYYVLMETPKGLNLISITGRGFWCDEDFFDKTIDDVVDALEDSGKFLGQLSLSIEE